MPVEIVPYPFRDMEIKRKARQRRLRLLILVFIALGLAFIILNERLTGNPLHAQAQVRSSATTLPEVDPTGTPDITSTPSLPAPSKTSLAVATLTDVITPTQSVSLFDGLALDNGTIFFSVSEGGYSHLFAYHPQYLPFTRLTNGAWDDITPAASPDGTRVAFASNRGGHWDLYILDLASGELAQLTDTFEYDASPSWSPDSQWIVYESYAPLSVEENSATEAIPATPPASGATENLDLFIRPVTAGEGSGQETIRLTNHPAADTSPVWSPNGRQIAFSSNRNGDEEIWLADLDRIEDRFQNVSALPAPATSTRPGRRMVNGSPGLQAPMGSKTCTSSISTSKHPPCLGWLQALRAS